MSHEAFPTTLDAPPAPAADLSLGDLRSARAAITIVFLVNGTEIGIWAAYIPLLKATHQLSEQRLGFVLLGFALGAIATMTMTGWLTARWNSGRVMVAAGVLCCGALSLPALAPSVAAFAAAAVVLGAANGAMDISMNAHASALERVWRAHIMSSFHAFFSLGGLIGASAGSILIARRFDASSGMPLASAILALVVLATAPIVWRTLRLAASDEHHTHSASAPARPWRALAALGIVGFLCAVAGGAMVDWTAIYLSTVLGAAVSVAAFGFASFSLAMTAGRLAGDQVVSRLGHPVTLAASGWLAAAGLTLAVLAARPLTASVGFGIAGLGLANIIPIVFSQAGRSTPTAPGIGVSTVATMGYAGFLLGPPIIGFVAGHVGLRIALGILSIAAVVIGGIGTVRARQAGAR